MSFFPVIDSNNPRTLSFATNTTLFALFIGAIAGLFMIGPPKDINPAYLKYLFTIFDPYALQILALGHCCVCLAFFIYSSKELNKSRFILNTIISIFILILLFLCFYFINDHVFKKAFDRPRPFAFFENNVGFLAKHFEHTSKEGAPSGFATRGVFILLTSTLAGYYIDQKKGILRVFTSPKVILIFQFVLLTLCCWARVGVGFHYWFDIFVGISLGTFIFWLFNIFYKWLILSLTLEDFTP